MFRSATLDNFYNDMQTVYDREKEFDMKYLIIRNMMDSWAKQKHYPVLKVKNEIPDLKIEIENYDSLNLTHIWWIPVIITKQTKPDFTISKNTYYHEWISRKNYYNKSLHFFVKEDEWYIINLQQIGKYLFYD